MGGLSRQSRHRQGGDLLKAQHWVVPIRPPVTTTHLLDVPGRVGQGGRVLSRWNGHVVAPFAIRRTCLPITDEPPGQKAEAIAQA